MIELIEPDEKYLQSYIEAYNEYVDNHVTTYAFKDARSKDIFSMFDDFRNERSLPPGLVGESTYWLADSENTRFIGEISIRHRLTEKLLQRDGHN